MTYVDLRMNEWRLGEQSRRVQFSVRGVLNELHTESHLMLKDLRLEVMVLRSSLQHMGLFPGPSETTHCAAPAPETGDTNSVGAHHSAFREADGEAVRRRTPRPFRPRPAVSAQPEGPHRVRGCAEGMGTVNKAGSMILDKSRAGYIVANRGYRAHVPDLPGSIATSRTLDRA
jgi:hypothetical protein